MKPKTSLTLTLQPVPHCLSLSGPAAPALRVSTERLQLDFAPVLRGEPGEPGPPGDVGYDTDLVLIYQTAKL